MTENKPTEQYAGKTGGKVKKKGVAAKLMERKKKTESQASALNEIEGSTSARSEQIVEKKETEKITENVNEDKPYYHIKVSTKEKEITRFLSEESSIDKEHEIKHKKPKPKPRRFDEEHGRQAGMENGEVPETQKDVNEKSPEIQTEPVTPSSHRSRNIRMAHLRSNSVESLKNSQFTPQPPSTPRRNSTEKMRTPTLEQNNNSEPSTSKDSPVSSRLSPKEDTGVGGKSKTGAKEPIATNLSKRLGSAPDITLESSPKKLGSTSALNTMTIKEARSRSSSVGGVASATLMGATELERYFPDRQIHVWIGTWNMMEVKSVANPMTDFLLPESSKFLQNIYVIGTQENAMNKREWEIHIQSVLGPTFVLYHSVTHGSLHLAVFVHRDLIWFCSEPEDDIVSTRAVTVVKTKGAIAISFSFFGTSMLFINCHLTSDQSRKKDRLIDYQKIISGIKLPKSKRYLQADDVTATFDCVYWCGDLNFRIERKRDAVEGKVTQISQTNYPNYEQLIKSDQLTKILTDGKIFQGFQEGRITFRPTYKYDVNTNDFDTSKKNRIPSYTDRIMFRSKTRNLISCLLYDSVMSIQMSDHKPVFGIYQVAVKPGKDFITSVGGHFNKDVYVAANQRRALALNSDTKTQKASTVCSIQ